MFESLNDELSDLLASLKACEENLQIFISENFDLWHRKGDDGKINSLLAYTMNKELRPSCDSLLSEAMRVEISFESLNSWFPLQLFEWEEYDDYRYHRLIRIDNKL